MEGLLNNIISWCVTCSNPEADLETFQDVHVSKLT